MTEIRARQHRTAAVTYDRTRGGISHVWGESCY